MAEVSDVRRSTISPQPGQTYCHSIVTSPSFRAWRKNSTAPAVVSPCCSANRWVDAHELAVVRRTGEVEEQLVHSSTQPRL